MIASIAAVAVGLALLAWAADQFVIGAARVATIRRVPTLVVGIVIVGFGTSAPELLVSTLAAAAGEAEVAVGNVVGSNATNLTLLLGLGALITPIAVASTTVRREAPFALAAVAAYAALVQGGFTRSEGLILLAAAVVTLTAVARTNRHTEADPMGADAVHLTGRTGKLAVEVARTAGGLIGTITGAQLLLRGAVDLADRAGLSHGFVGATLVALGTSLPELVTVVQCARRREVDLIVGNLLGSNLFNALAVGGLAAVVGPAALDAPELTTTGALTAVIATAAALVLLRTGHRVTRREGAALIVAYLLITALLATT